MIRSDFLDRLREIITMIPALLIIVIPLMVHLAGVRRKKRAQSLQDGPGDLIRPGGEAEAKGFPLAEESPRKESPMKESPFQASPGKALPKKASSKIEGGVSASSGGTPYAGDLTRPRAPAGAPANAPVAAPVPLGKPIGAMPPKAPRGLPRERRGTKRLLQDRVTEGENAANAAASAAVFAAGERRRLVWSRLEGMSRLKRAVVWSEILSLPKGLRPSDPLDPSDR